MDKNILEILKIVGITFLFSASIMPLMKKVAHHIGAVDVPRTEPAVVAIASGKSALLILGSLPFSSRKLAFAHTPIRAPILSNKSTNRNETTITAKSAMLMV